MRAGRIARDAVILVGKESCNRLLVPNHAGLQKAPGAPHPPTTPASGAKPPNKLCFVTSALGHERTFSEVCGMSALPPKADIGKRHRDVRFVPKADSSTAAKIICV
jgi:hypothetical protein